MSTWWSGPVGPGHDGPEGGPGGPGRVGAWFTRTMSGAANSGIGYAEAAGAAVWAGARGAAGMARQVWIEDRPRRQFLRASRRRRWWDKGGEWRLLVGLEVIGVAAFVTARTAWRITRNAPGGARAGAEQGWRQARTRRAGNDPGTGSTGPAWASGPTRTGSTGPAWTGQARPDPDPVIEVTVDDLPRQPRPAGGAPGPTGPVQTEVIIDVDDQADVDVDDQAGPGRPRPAPAAAGRGPSVLWSPDFDDYATGRIGAEQIRCVLCEQAPCACPPMGSPESRSPEYLALIDRRHGRTPRPAASSTPRRTPSSTSVRSPQDTGVGRPVAQLPEAGTSTQPGNTTQEEDLMSMPSLAVNAAARGGGVQTSLGGELASPADLLAEASHVQTLAERAATVQAQLDAWAAGLPELVTAAPWGTGAVASAADGIAQAQGTDGLRETITGLHGALDAADELGESLGSIGATGSVDALAGGQ